MFLLFFVFSVRMLAFLRQDLPFVFRCASRRALLELLECASATASGCASGLAGRLQKKRNNFSRFEFFAIRIVQKQHRIASVLRYSNPQNALLQNQQRASRPIMRF